MDNKLQPNQIRNAFGIFQHLSAENYEEQKLNIMTKNTLRKNSLSRLVQASIRRCNILDIFIPITYMMLFERIDGKWVPNYHASEKMI